MDYTQEAEALFTRYAERHGLCFEPDTSAPVEILWRFPKQKKLTHPIVLALQNGDELNFGVADFWSYFFPFPLRAEAFQAILEAWTAGNARVVTGIWGMSLQIRDVGGWRRVYTAGRLWPNFRRAEPIHNRPS